MCVFCKVEADGAFDISKTLNDECHFSCGDAADGECTVLVGDSPEFMSFEQYRRKFNGFLLLAIDNLSVKRDMLCRYAYRKESKNPNDNS